MKTEGSKTYDKEGWELDGAGLRTLTDNIVERARRVGGKVYCHPMNAFLPEWKEGDKVEYLDDWGVLITPKPAEITEVENTK